VSGYAATNGAESWPTLRLPWSLCAIR